jgi:hypothetical protein
MTGPVRERNLGLANSIAGGSMDAMGGRDGIVVAARMRTTHKASPDTIIVGNPAVKIGGGQR